jgi:hypothetical protein
MTLGRALSPERPPPAARFDWDGDPEEPGARRGGGFSYLGKAMPHQKGARHAGPTISPLPTTWGMGRRPVLLEFVIRRKRPAASLQWVRGAVRRGICKKETMRKPTHWDPAALTSCEHRNGFAFMCMVMCTSRRSSRAKSRTHSRHRCGSALVGREGHVRNVKEGVWPRKNEPRNDSVNRRSL